MNGSAQSLTQPEPRLHSIFLGPNGLRAGWRLLIFFGIMVPAGYALGKVIDSYTGGPDALPDTPSKGAIMMGGFAALVLLVSWIMAKIEGRSLAAYGLPWRRAFCRQYWQGAAVAVISLPILLLTLRVAGVFSFGTPMLHGSDILKYGAAWIFAMFSAALLEDFFYRGYLLFTLATGIGFWPAAIATSLWMGGMHYLNPGGHGLGPIVATEYCLVTCLVIRRTDDLWMPLGIHSVWDWSAAFLYGVPSSGFAGHPRFLNANLHGPAWLTGGTFGPEASVPAMIMLALWGLGFALFLREVKYPNPAAIPDPCKRTRLTRAPLAETA
jgi:membrane protease YdiL (CAAX protease family)